MKEDENQRLSLAWNLNRTLAKVNYRIHTDAIKENIIPSQVNKTQQQIIYASEADLLNVALFGKTAKQWRKENKGKEKINDIIIAFLIILIKLRKLSSQR